jgi:hypothetical protein
MRGLLMKRTVLLGTLATGLVLALSACGGGGGSSTKIARPPSTTATKTVPKATTPTPKAKSHNPAPASAAPTQTQTRAPAAKPKPKAPSLPVSECRRLNVLAAKMGQAFTGRTPTADTKAYADYLQQLSKTAPTEIRGDFGVLADAYTKFAGAVAAVYTKPGATPSPDDLKKLSDVGKELNEGALKHAAANVNVWLQTGCSR